MQIFVIFYDAAGTKLGAGEIQSAYDFEHTRRLSRAGRFSFKVPLNDPRLLDVHSDGRAVLSEKRTTRVFGVVPLADGTLEQWDLGGGVVDRITRTAPDALTVEGDDLMRELTYRSVLGLQNLAIDDQTPARVLFEDATLTPSNYSDLTLTYDNNPATFDSFILPANDKYLLVGSLDPFLTIRFDMSAFNNNAAVMNFGFSDGGDGWSELEPFTDSTVSGGAPLAQDGVVAYTARPGEWEPSLINGTTAYWVRMDPDALLDNIQMNEIYVGVAVPTTNDLSNIMGFAPSGWALDTTDWYGSTTNGSFYRFSDENVLEALVRTAEITGEHFRLGEGREIEWMRGDLPDSGVHAVAVTDPASLGGAQVCYIVDIEEITESYELATRAYGRGAGMGTEALDISERTESDPANYTTDVENVIQTDQSTEEFWYIESDVGVATYGRIESFYVDKGITGADGFAARDVTSANTLWTSVLKWLQKHDRPQYFYRLTVAGLQEELKVGTTIRVQYRRVVEENGVPQLSWDIDDDLIIIETTNVVGTSGAYTTGLTVSTVADWFDDDRKMLTKMRREQKDYMRHNQGVSRYSVR
jgi:hypothetical protein